MGDERELYAIFDRSPIGMLRSTREGRLTYANPALATMLGYSHAELMTKNMLEIYEHPADREALFAQYLASGKLDGVRLRWKRRDGARVFVEMYGNVTDAGSFNVWIVDVTREQDARQKLQRTADILDLVVRQVPAVYWWIDRDMKIVGSGGASQEVVGYGLGTYVGKTLTEHDRASPSAVDTAQVHRRALEGEIVSFDNEYNGRHLACTIGPLRGADGDIVGAIGTASDVTRARQLERKMIDAQRAESLGVLAGGLAHDFNNLLVAVLGNADLALREIRPHAPARGEIENIRDAGLRAAELTDQLLAYAGRGGAGTTRVHPLPVVDELLRILRPTFPASVRVDISIPAELQVRADPAQIRQVLLNLITNARDSGARALTVRGRAFRHGGEHDDDDILAAATGTYALLEVQDDGPGMDRETRRHVFEPFFTTKPTGHGLGLAAVLGIVRAHGGGIRVTTAPGHGACFRILWPTVDPSSQRAASPIPAAPRTVLVIDDEDMVRDVVARMIEDLGYAAITAQSGADGLDVLARQPIDAVLVDLTMPQMSGADVIAALRQAHPNLPVVVCSGYDRGGKGPVKADAYLPKPFRIDALERTLAKLLG